MTGKAKIPGQGKTKDSATKVYFRNSGHFAEVFNRTIFTDEPINADKLEERDTDETAFVQVTKDSKIVIQQYRDVSKNLREGQILAILGIEDQSLVNYQMPFRVLEMEFISYARQIQTIAEQHRQEASRLQRKIDNAEVQEDAETGAPLRHPDNGIHISGAEYISGFHRSDRLIPVITLVIYYGTEEWDAARSLSEMFQDTPWSGYASDYRMNLLEVNKLTEEELNAYGDDLKTLFGFVKYSRDYKKLRKFMEDNESLFRRVSTETVDAIAELTHSKELAKVMEQKNSQKGEVDMCVALRDMMEESKEQGIEQGIERGIEQGIERGIEQGIEQGIERGINLVAENMIKANKPASEIEMFTGLSIDHLKKMARKMGVALVI